MQCILVSFKKKKSLKNELKLGEEILHTSDTLVINHIYVECPFYVLEWADVLLLAESSLCWRALSAYL